MVKKIPLHLLLFLLFVSVSTAKAGEADTAAVSLPVAVADTVSSSHDYALGDVVVTGTRNETDIRHLPMTLSVVGRKALETRYEPSIFTALNEQVPGLFTTSRGVMGYGVSDGAAGSISGGLDIRPFPTNWKMQNQLGEFASNKKRWDEHTVINLIPSLKDGDLAIIIDCGVDDFFLEVNRRAHQSLLDHNIKHDYIERPGAHNNAYWNNSIDYQLLFFHKFFAQPKESKK